MCEVQLAFPKAIWKSEDYAYSFLIALAPWTPSNETGDG